MKLKPLHDLLIVKRDVINTSKTASGIFVIDSSLGKGDRGTVVAVGPGRRKANGDLVPTGLKEGQKVLFGRHSGHTVKVDGVEILLMRTEDVFAIIN